MTWKRVVAESAAARSPSAAPLSPAVPAAPAQGDDADLGPAASRLTIILALLGVAALLGLLGYGVLVKDPGRRAGLVVNSEFSGVPVTPHAAADFALPLFATNGSAPGATFRLSDARGKVVMVDFWASWCGPCREEAPALAQVWNRYRDRDVVFVGVNTLGDRQPDALAFLQRYGITYLNGQDAGRIAVEYGVTGVPEKFFIDRDGKLVRRLIGPVSASALSTALDELLR